jgi:hypothetical protein
MDWFEKITGFREGSYEETRRLLNVEDGRLLSRHGPAWSMGRLETPTLAELRRRAAPHLEAGRATTVRTVVGDVRALHAQDEHAGALFQAASQFNLLEMTGPQVTPEDGVTGYAQDRTQGPACAIAAGAATIYRNYLVPVGGGQGQRADRQIDCLADLGVALGNDRGRLWTMRNGYARSTRQGLREIERILDGLTDGEVDALRGFLRVGLHTDVDVTDRPQPGHRVSQVFCSALPIGYSDVPAPHWERFARLVLDATYEATMLAAVLNRAERGNATVFLTRVGGGVFRNDPQWIDDALQRAVRIVAQAGLDVRLVSYR